MADSKVPKFEDTEPLFEETEPIDVSSESNEEPGLGNTLVAKVAQGATLGFDDELAGLLSAAGTAAGVKNLGGKIKDVGLTEEGPTLDMDKLLAAYRGTRDQTRQTQQEMQDARPIVSTTANVAGGLATLPAMPAKLLAPMGATPAGAGIITKAGMGAANALPTAAIASAGLSNADLTQGDVGQAGQEIATGTALGAGIGGALPVVGAGLKSAGQGVSNLANKMIPDTVKNAWKVGKEGIDHKSQEFYDAVTKRYNDLVKSVSDPMTQKSAAQTQAALDEISALEGKLTMLGNDAKSSAASTEAREAARVQAEMAKRAEAEMAMETQIASMQDKAKKAVELGQSKAKVSSAEDVAKLNQDTVKVAKDLQNQVAGVKKALGTKFDELDKAAEATGIVPRNEDVLAQFGQKLSDNSGLPQTEVETILRKVAPVMGKTDIQSYRNLKGTLSNYFEHANPVVRKSAKEAYANLKNNYAKDLSAGGYADLANDIANTNKRWSSAIDLEDQFLSNLRPDRVTGQIEASPDTIRAVGNFAEKTPVQMAEADQLTKLLGVLDPEGSPQAIRKMEGLAQDVMATKGMKPEVPMLPDPRISQAQAQLEQMKAMPKPQAESLPALPNPEIARLESLLQQAKSKVSGADKIEGVNLSTNPKTLEEQLNNLLPKFRANSGDNIAENRLDEVFNLLRKEKGDDYVNALQDQIKKGNAEMNLRDAANLPKDINLKKAGAGGAIGAGIGFTTGGPAGAAAGGLIGGVAGSMADKMVGGATGLANVAGRAVNKSQNFLKTGVKKLSDATPEQIKQLAATMASKGTAGQEYAKVLSEAQNKNGQSRNAIMFSLMQQPAFRKLFHEANGTHEVEENEDTGN